MVTRQCVILVGGLGTRLGALTAKVPKPLLPVGDHPFLETLLREAARRGFDDIVLLAGYRHEVVEDYLRQSAIAETLSVHIRISAEPAPMGTGGALLNAASLLASEFLLLNGDTGFDFNWLDLAARAQVTGCVAAMALRHIDHPDRYDTVELNGYVVSAFRLRTAEIERGLINGGVYWLKKSVIDGMHSPSSLENDVLPGLCRRRLLVGMGYDGYFVDIGIHDTYAAAQSEIPDRLRRPAIFFDRDGVLNKDTGYVHGEAEFEWVDGAVEAVRYANDRGYYAFVVTNQAGVAHGYYGEDAPKALHSFMLSQLREAGANFDDWRYCPYHPGAKVEAYRKDSHWRKPGPGMILDLAGSWPVDMPRSFLVGDKYSDIGSANAAGIPGYLFTGGNLLAFIRTILP